MRAYAVLDGGGVKGAALVGALKAAEQCGLEFAGYGGTSAGSIVALLAAVGYTADELKHLLSDELDMTSLLDGGIGKLREAKHALSSIQDLLNDANCFGKVRAFGHARKLVDWLDGKNGLYEGDRLKEFLIESIGKKIPALADQADVSFSNLADAGCKPLKIVASDITRHRPALFSREDDAYGTSVIDAVRASASYPFVFRPVAKNARILVDGGVTSNLPSFMFDEESRRSLTPVLAFDLVPAGSGDVRDLGLKEFARRLMTTALEASDVLIRKVSTSIVHIPIKTPADIDTLDFDLSDTDKRRLWESGYNDTRDFLDSFEPVIRMKSAGTKLRKQLIASYVSPRLVAPILEAIARQVEAGTSAESVRCSVMVPTGRGTRMVIYEHGMSNDADFDLELGLEGGGSGEAWLRKAPLVADLTESRKNPSQWGMTEEEHRKVPLDRMSMLSVPIHAPIPSGDTDPPMPIATLSIDSTTPLLETRWLSGRDPNAGVRGDLVKDLMNWSYVVYKVLS